MRPRLIEDADLLDNLLEAFADLGYEGASMRALCRHLGLSHNLINQRFSSKDAAWYAAVDHAFMQLNELLAKPLSSEDPVEGVRELMNRFVDATVAHPALSRIIHQEAARPGPRYEHMFEGYIGPYQGVVHAELSRLQDEGILRPGPITTAYFFLNTWGVGGIASSQALAQRVGGPEVDPLEAARLAVDMVIDGLLEPSARASALHLSRRSSDG